MGERMRSECLMGTEFQSGKMERVLKMMDGGDGCTTVCMCLMSLNWTPKNDSNGKFCYVYFTTKKVGKKMLQDI